MRLTTRPLELRLDPDVCNGATIRHLKCGNQLRHESLKIQKTVGLRSKDHDSNVKRRKILLKRKIAIDGEEDIEVPGRKRKQFTIL